MAQMWKPQPREVILGWLDALQDKKELTEDLTEWEMNFVESIRRQIRYKESLTEQQQETLEIIYANKTK